MATKKVVAAASTVKRTVYILVRYLVKLAHGPYPVGSLVFQIANDQGEQYQVVLRRNGVHTCTCEGHVKWRKQCYHITDCRELHNQRLARRKAELDIEAIVAEAEIELSKS